MTYIIIIADRGGAKVIMASSLMAFIVFMWPVGRDDRNRDGAELQYDRAHRAGTVLGVVV